MADDLKLALLIDAAAAARSPLDRFVDELSGDLQAFAKETIRLREEFIAHAQAMITTSPAEANTHAEWLARNAHEIAYRWSSLAESAVTWASRHPEAFAFRYGFNVPAPGKDGA